MGILPRAFSDIPLTCMGTESSTDEEIDAARELLTEFLVGGLCIDLPCLSSSVSSSSSSSPIVKAPLSSGTVLIDGDRALTGLRAVSLDVTRLRSGLVGSAIACSFLSWFWRSISSCPLSRVNSRRAWNRFCERSIAYTTLGLLENLCSTIEFIASSRECSSEWFVSFAKRKAGEDMEANNWSSFELATLPKPSV